MFKTLRKAISVLCVIAVLVSASVITPISANAKTSPNKYPAPSELRATSYSETTARVAWKLSKKLKKKAGFQVLVYDVKQKKYISAGHTRNKHYDLKNLSKDTPRKIAVRTYVKKGKKYYYGKSAVMKLPLPVKGIELKSVKFRSKGKVTVTWHKSDIADGYLFQYSTNDKFSKGNASTLIFNDKDKKSVDVTGLGKAKYYFRVTPYKVINGNKYAAKWSAVKTLTVENGCSFSEMLNTLSTDLSGRKEIYSLTKKGVDIKKYDTTYKRFRAIYNWHKDHAQDFASCYYFTINQNKCFDALFGETKKYDDFIRMADGNFQNRSGSRPVHKWTVLYLSGLPFVVDARMEGYIDTSCFGLPKGNKTEKRFLFKQWYASLRKQTVFDSGFAAEYKVL